MHTLTYYSLWCLFPELWSNEANDYQNNTWVKTEMVHQQSIHIILFLTQHNEFINAIKTMILTHLSRVSLAQFSFCWCHNRLLRTSYWPENRDAIMWIMISNSLDIDFIHSNIHSRLCKNVCFPISFDIKHPLFATCSNVVWSYIIFACWNDHISWTNFQKFCITTCGINVTQTFFIATVPRWKGSAVVLMADPLTQKIVPCTGLITLKDLKDLCQWAMSVALVTEDTE